MSATIPVWVDRDGRLWMDTGLLQRGTNEMVIELFNGEARGALSWVEKEFGPLERVGMVRE